MRKFILVALPMWTAVIAFAQEATPTPDSATLPADSRSTPAAAANVEALRQEVQSLTETVKALQQQVKDQQAALEKANLVGAPPLPQNPEPSVKTVQTSPSPGAAASAAS